MRQRTNLLIRRRRQEIVCEVELSTFEPAAGSHSSSASTCVVDRRRRVGLPGAAVEPLDTAEIGNGLPERSYLRNGPLMKLGPSSSRGVGEGKARTGNSEQLRSVR